MPEAPHLNLAAPAPPATMPEAPPESPPPAGERRAWLLGFALGLGGFAVLGVLLALAALLAAGPPPRTVLLLGLDVRPDEQQRGVPGHTDTIAVLALAPGRATLISFPRDLWVEIPGYGPERLNVAYPLGARSGRPADGAALLARTLATEFGLVVDHWACVDFRGFAALVDALGGVEVTVPRTIVDETYPTD
ncbi:MAG TPA: LCP family protein, partial [Chloroflexota bacterium]|nr:LCP family protein [Chloroflexota bacterium]